MKAQGYCIIYLWRGERHRFGHYIDRDSDRMRDDLAMFRRDGYRAWTEEL